MGHGKVPVPLNTGGTLHVLLLKIYKGIRVQHFRKKVGKLTKFSFRSIENCTVYHLKEFFSVVRASLPTMLNSFALVLRCIRASVEK